MQGAAAAVNGKDGASSIRPPPPRLLRPLLLVAVLGTGFLAVVALLLGGGSSTSSSLLPGLSAASASPRRPQHQHQQQQACAGSEAADAASPALDRWTRAPASAWHNMSDEELLWAASWQPLAARYPFRRTPKVAFLFLTRGPLPLAPLWDRFFAGAPRRSLYSVYVHATPGYRPGFPPSSAFHGRLVPSQAARWGEASVLDAERRLLANALLDPGNGRFVLLSESCAPLFGFPAVHAYLTRSRHSFVGAFDDPGPNGRGRYRPALAPEVRRRQWRKGAQWFELARGLAVAVVADARYYPKFRDHCRAPCYADEHYLPTLLTIEAPARIANRSVTWVDWSRGGAHPATFGEADVGEAFLRRLTATAQGNCTYNGQPAEVCFLFARKFAPGALRPLMQLAPKLLGYG
ncbi:hypothetical protein BS78_08G168200 [Paspalum vaginatum]|nr:hypothetical protein BS78_08G168200 [Paspalum vaginatum]KAJ1266652.1 hypothetical protein BS78_08G168200 [Paspalum vaginatum]